MKKKITFIFFLLSFSFAYSQSSIGDDPYFYMLATKSMEMKNGKIDFIENKKLKGTKNSITTYYTLIFSKNVFYKTENKKINIHFFNEQDSILYIVDDDASYLIDYKKRRVIINERDEVIFMIRKNHLFANFYSNQAGGNLLLMGRIRDFLKTDFSTTIFVSEQKIFTGKYNLHFKTSLSDDNLFCYDKYEFRNTDTLLIQYVSKISNPYNYEKGTIVEIETKLLYALLDNEEYEKSYYYNYAEFCNDDFLFYDKRKSLVVDDYIYHNENLEKNDKTTLQSLIAESKGENIHSSNFLELESGMMSLYMQVKEGQQQIAAQKAEWKKITDIRIFNINLYTLPAKNIESVPYREMEMVNVSLTIPLTSAEIIEDEYLVENHEENMIVDEVGLPSESVGDIVADTVVLLTETKFEDFLSEEFVEENPVDIIELDTEEILVEEIFEKDFAADKIADLILIDAEIEEIVFEEIISDKNGEEKFAEIIILESKTKDIFIREIPVDDFVADKIVNDIFPDTELENIVFEEIISNIIAEEEFTETIIHESETEIVAIEEIISEEFVEEIFVESIPELKIGNIFVEETLREDSIEDKIADVILSDTELENIVLEEIISNVIAEEEFTETIIHESETEIVAIEEIISEEFVEEIFVEGIPELEIGNIFVEEIVLEEPAKNEIIDTVISESLVEIDIIEVDFNIFKKNDLSIDTMVLTTFLDEVTEDTLNIVRNRKIASTSLEFPVIVEDVKVEVIFLESSTEKDSISEVLGNKLMYYIVLNYFKDMENAEAFFNDQNKSYNNLIHLGKDLSSDTFMVGIGPYQTEDKVRDKVENLRINGVRGWILRQ